MKILDKLNLEPNNGPDSGPDLGEQFARDPEPGQRVARPAKPAPAAPRKPAPPTMAKMAKEVADNLSTLIELGSAVWGITDDCCAPVLEQQARPIADAFAAILARNPKLLAQFAQADLAVLAVQCAAAWKAIQPVGMAIWRNHVSKADDDDEDGDKSDGRINLGNFPPYPGAATRPVPA